MRISTDQRGKIKTGTKIPNPKKEGGTIPKSLDYFKIDAFPELVNAYGNKPEKLFVMFPVDEIEGFFSTEYNLWAQKGDSVAVKKRYCDSQECVHVLQETVNGKDYAPGEISTCLCFNEDIPKKTALYGVYFN